MADNKETREVEILLNAQQANASIKDMAAGVALMNNQLAKMGQDDPRREQLKKDFQDLKARVKEARDEINGFTKSEEELRAETEKLTQANAETILNGQKLTSSYREMRDAAGLLEKQLEELSADDPGRERLIADYQQLKTRMAEAKLEFGGAAQAAEALRLQELALAEANEKLIENGRRSGASFNEMKAAAGLLEKQLHAVSADDPGRAAMIRDYQLLQQRIGAAKTEMATYVKTEEELRAETEQLRLETERLNQKNVEVILNGQKLNSSFKDMKASAGLLEQQLHEMSADDPGRKKLLDDYHSLQDRIGGVTKEMKGATEGTSFLKQGFANAFAFFAGGGIIELAQRLFGFFASAREEYLSSAKSSADLEATLLATKNAAGLTADEIRAIGTERAKYTLFDDDETNRASAMLLTFKNVKKGVFEEAIPAIQDLATKMAGDGPADMKGASIQLGKALNDPIKGITALTRVGVTFTDQQKEQIAQMVKMGNTAGAQKLILAELNSEFGGSAEAARKAAGGIATLSMGFNEFKETVGSKVNAVLDELSQWFGRVLDKSQPLIDMVTELADQFVAYYDEVADVVEGLGLFNDKTDTAAVVVEVLKTALTVLLFPMRLALDAAKGVVDIFIDWYNKSELLRGVLGGLGAVIVSVFTTIKDDALKILGGVGDIIVGIFTLDKNKIVAGFKSALAATADAALEGGNKAADAFMKGYEASKDKRITRTVRVDTQETKTSTGGGTPTASAEEPAGESEKDKKAREAAEKKAKAARDKADQERLNDVKKWVKDEGDLLDGRNALDSQREEAHYTDKALRRLEQEKKIREDADKHYESLNSDEANYTEQVTALVAERDLKLRELQAKFNEEDERERKAGLDEKIKQNQAEVDEEAAYLQLQLADGMLAQAGYDESLYQAKQAAKARELALIKQKNGEESAEYKKLNADMLKEQAAHTTKAKTLNDDYTKFKKGLGEVDKVLNNDNVKALEDSLGQQTIAYKAFKIARKADAIANIGIALWDEVQQYWKTASTMGPIAGPIYGVGMSGLAIVRQGLAAAKIAGFEKGGPTGDGMVVPRPANSGMMDMMRQATGMNVGANGKLTDEKGLEVAGIVHKNEYVIPEWMREDPEVLQVENWLEARRQRGSFAEGGPTSNDRAATSPAPAEPAEQANPNQRLVQVLDSLDQRLQKVEEWPSQLEVVLDLLGLDRAQEKIKKVKTNSQIKPK
jgi:hypothetical protein